MEKELFYQFIMHNNVKLTNYYIGMNESIYHIKSKDKLLIVAVMGCSSTTLERVIEAVNFGYTRINAITISDISDNA